MAAHAGALELAEDEEGCGPVRGQRAFREEMNWGNESRLKGDSVCALGYQARRLEQVRCSTEPLSLQRRVAKDEIST